EDAAGRTTAVAEPFAFTTPALPEDFPVPRATISVPERMDPGVTMLTVSDTTAGDALVMLDAAGEVVWDLRDPRLAPPDYLNWIAFPLPNGHLMLMVDRSALLEIDMLGNVLQGWSAAGAKPAIPGSIPVAVDSFHHELIALPEGDDVGFVTLGTEVRRLP